MNIPGVVAAILITSCASAPRRPSPQMEVVWPGCETKCQALFEEELLGVFYPDPAHPFCFCKAHKEPAPEPDPT